MMINWSLLGIKPTNDIKEIKRAYAKQTKQYHPEEDPEMFAKVLEAYQDALEYAKQIKSAEPDVVMRQQTEFISNKFDNDFETATKDLKQNYEQKMKNVMEQLKEIWASSFRASQITKLQKLLKSNDFKDIYLDRIFLDNLCSLLLTDKYIPRQVYVELYKEFGFHENQPANYMTELENIHILLEPYYWQDYIKKEDKKKSRCSLQNAMLFALTAFGVVGSVFVVSIYGLIVASIMIGLNIYCYQHWTETPEKCRKVFLWELGIMGLLYAIIYCI